MKILLVGGAGFIGRHLLRALVKRGDSIIVCSRTSDYQPEKDQKVETKIVDLVGKTDSGSWLALLQGVDVVINAAGIIKESGRNTFDIVHTLAPLALFKACEKAGIRRVLQISAVNADSQSEAIYYASKGRADDELRCLELDWLILRPSLVYGDGARTINLLRGLAALPIVPIPGDGKQCLQPVHIDDLVEAVLRYLDGDIPPRTTLDVVGPEPASVKDLLQEQRFWLGKCEATFVSIPIVVLKALSPLASWLEEPALNIAAVALLNGGNTADVKPFEQLLGRKPKSINTALQESLAGVSDKLFARLYFCRPLLRSAIAFVWIWSGWVSIWIYPIVDSYRLLERVGVDSVLQPFALYGASAVDIALGLATLYGRLPRLITSCQITVILLYTVVITIWLPGFWEQPFGSLSKNLPLIAATLVLLVLEEEKI